MTFKVGTTSYANNVVIGTYEVNQVPVYDEWTDANGGIHRLKIRDKIQGSFDLFFRTATAYSAFKTVVDNQTSSSDLSTLITLSVNNLNSDATGIHAYLDFKPVRDVDGTRVDYYKVMKVSIEER